MKVLQICDFAAKYRGNFIESLDYLEKNFFDENDLMVYAFPSRMLKRNNAWFDEFRTQKKAEIYSSDYRSMISNFRRIVIENKIELIHTHFTDIKTDMCINLACRGLKVKKIKHYRSSFGTWNRIKLFVSDICYDKWSAVVCVSPFIGEEAGHNIRKAKSIVINDAVYLPRLDECERLYRKSYGISDDSILCFMIGYDYRLKGIDLACEAVAELRKSKNICLAICIASNKDKIESEIAGQFGGMPEYIKLLDPRQDIASYYNMADIYIQASRSEGFCYAIIEAAYCGKVVVASDCPGMKSHAENNLSVLWFKNGSAEDLKERINDACSFIGDGEFIENNRRSSVEKYGIKSYSEKIYGLYREIIDKR